MASNNVYDLSDAIKELDYILVGHPKTSARGQAVLCAIDALEHILNGDLVSVIHAKWIESLNDGPLCSNCNYAKIGALLKFKYCPNCGAKMEGEE